MDQAAVEQLVEELLESFEVLESQNMAILQFLKDKGTATDEQLAPYLDQAATASNVKWQAGRMRIKRLLSSAMKSDEEETEKSAAKTAEAAPDEKEGEHSDKGREQSSVESGEKERKAFPVGPKEKPAEDTNRTTEGSGQDTKQTAEQASRSEQPAEKDAA